MWIWTITSGTITSSSGTVVGHGYSGHGDGLNNSAMCNVPDVGPLPAGIYTIGQPHEDEHVGVFALPLTPYPDNEMFGRSAFFIHGDNPSFNHSASDGCIILVRALRGKIAASKDSVLVVRA